MTEWKDVLQLVGSTLGSSSGDTVLDFLRILPEEVTEGRKINLSVRGKKMATAFNTLSNIHMIEYCSLSATVI